MIVKVNSRSDRGDRESSVRRSTSRQREERNDIKDYQRGDYIETKDKKSKNDIISCRILSINDEDCTVDVKFSNGNKQYDVLVEDIKSIHIDDYEKDES